MIDTQALNERSDLLAFAGNDTTLRKVATTGGGEWAGPCPFCGGHDRFRVQPYYQTGGRWLCRHCEDGRWQDSIAYVMKSENVEFKEAIKIMGAEDLPRSRATRARPEIPAYDAPPGDWQAQALKAIEVCEAKLWTLEGERALSYLRHRGLMDNTIKHFRLGYSPGLKIGEMWIKRGIVIPCKVNNEVWYLKLRLPTKEARKKYDGVRGNRPAAIFNGDDLINFNVALFVEGEIDAMTAWQFLSESMAVCTMGSATTLPDLATWGLYLMGPDVIMAAYDMDQAGEQGLAKLSLMSEKVKLAPLPEGDWKDVNDYLLAGGDIFEWISPYFESYASENSVTTRHASQKERKAK